MDPQTAVLIAQHGFALGLHGHVHQSGRFEALGSQASLPVVWAGSICAGSKERPPSIPLLYNVIGLNPGMRKGWVHTRARRNEAEDWSSYAAWGRRRKRCWYPLNLSLTDVNHNIIELQHKIEILTKENETHDKFCEDFRVKLSRYVRAKYPLKEPPVHALIDADMVFRCNDNGDCAGSLKLTICASREDAVHRFSWDVNADEEADAVRFIDQLTITATDTNSPKTDILWFPLRERRWSKLLCLFFIPQIDPGEQREIALTFQWPKFFQRLLDSASTECEWTESVRNKLRIEHVFPAKLAGITCMNDTPFRPTMSLRQEKTPTGGTSWIYECTEAPEITRHTLRLNPVIRR